MSTVTKFPLKRVACAATLMLLLPACRTGGQNAPSLEPRQQEASMAAEDPAGDGLKAEVDARMEQAELAAQNGESAQHISELGAALQLLERRGIKDAYALEMFEYLAASHYEGERWAAAERCLAHAVELRDAGLSLESDLDPTDKADRLMELAFCRMHQGRPDAEGPARRAVEIYAREYGPRDDMTGGTLTELSEILAFRGHLAEAEATSVQALDIHLETQGEYGSAVANDLEALALIQNGLGRPEEAALLQERALLLWEPAAPSPAQLAINLSNQAVTARDLGDLDRAVELMESAHAQLLKFQSADDRWLPMDELELAKLYIEVGRYDDVVALLRERIDAGEPRDTIARCDFANHMAVLGQAYEGMGEWGTAREHYYESAAILRDIWGPHSEFLEFPLDRLVELHAQENPGAGVSRYCRDLDAIRTYASRDSAFKWWVAYDHALAADSPEDVKLAHALWHRTVELARELDSPTHLAMSLLRLGRFHLLVGEDDKAAEDCHAAVTLFERELGWDDFLLHQALRCEGRALHADGRGESARAVEERIARIEAYWDSLEE